MNRDPAIISTALDVLREQHEHEEAEPGAGGPSRKTLISG